MPGSSRGRRVAATSIPVQRSGLDGQSLPFPDNSFDAALSTWTMCTIPDVAAALAELRRVLKPGGTLHFLEHGLAPDESVRRWQRRIEPVNKRIFGGCHLTKPIAELIAAAGFTVTDLDVFYEKGAPKFAGADSLGIATVPASPGYGHPSRRLLDSGRAAQARCQGRTTARQRGALNAAPLPSHDLPTTRGAGVSTLGS